MSEDFVSFEIAKKLKEKGFNDACNAYYHICDDNIDSQNSFEYTGDMGYNFINSKNKYRCAAPTIYQALKWLRKEKSYHIEFIGNACGYLFIVSDIPSKGGTDRYCSDYSGPNDGGTWDIYEEAALAGIEYVLDNLI